MIRLRPKHASGRTALGNCLRRSQNWAIMVHMVARPSIVLSCLSAAVLGGCSGGSQAAQCVPGLTVDCPCPTGQQGAQTCTSAGTFAACVCLTPNPDDGGVNGASGAGGSDAPVAMGVADGSDAPFIPGSTATGGAAGSGTTPAIVSLTSFTASPTTIAVGQSSTLSWKVSGATTLSIDQGVGSVLGKTSQVVTPTQTTSYTLTLDSYMSAQVTVDVVAVLQGIFATTGSMHAPRATHTATLLGTGNVLIAGGGRASAELYDPAAGTFTATGSMTGPRAGHTATLLPNGKVLIAGGEGVDYLASAELYDLVTGTFAATGSMTAARANHTATLLPNGKVLIAGGEGTGDAGPNVCLASAELYDPAAATFAATGSMTVARFEHTEVLLGNGNVLIAGGLSGSQNPLANAELYDQAVGTFAATGSMSVARNAHTATLLPSGKVLMAGGNGVDLGYLASAELYDAATGTFTAIGSMTVGRDRQTATLLVNGKVLIAGGAAGGTASAELCDPTPGTFAATGGMAVGRSSHTAALLPNGNVLIAGGFDGSGNSLTSAELYYE